MEDIRAKREASFAQAAAGLDEKARSMLHDMLFNDPFYYGDIKTDEPRTLDFSGVRGFLVTNVCIVQRSAA